MKPNKKINIIDNLNNLHNFLNINDNKIILILIKIYNNNLKNIEIIIKNNDNKILSNLILDNSGEKKEFIKEILEIIYQNININNLLLEDKIYLLKRINDIINFVSNIENYNFKIKGNLSFTFNLYNKKDKVIIKFDGKIDKYKINIISENIKFIFINDLQKLKLLYEDN